MDNLKFFDYISKMNFRELKKLLKEHKYPQPQELQIRKLMKFKYQKYMHKQRLINQGNNNHNNHNNHNNNNNNKENSDYDFDKFFEEYEKEHGNSVDGIGNVNDIPPKIQKDSLNNNLMDRFNCEIDIRTSGNGKFKNKNIIPAFSEDINNFAKFNS